MAGFFDVLAAGANAVANTLSKQYGNFFGDQASNGTAQNNQKPQASNPVTIQAPQAGGIWQSISQGPEQAQPQQQAWQAPQSYTPVQSNQNQGSAPAKKKEKAEAEETSAPGTDKTANGNGNFWDVMMQSVMQNPDAQAIMANPINAFVPQTAEAQTGDEVSSKPVEYTGRNGESYVMGGPQPTDEQMRNIEAERNAELSEGKQGKIGKADDATKAAMTPSGVNFDMSNVDYMADPNAIAMPSGEQMSQLSPAEREQWQNTTGFLAALVGSGMVAPAAAGLLGGSAGLATMIPATGLAIANALSANQENVDKKVDEEKETEAKAKEAGVEPEQLIYGKSPQEISQMYEDAIYDLAMQDEDYRKAFNDAGYGDLYGSYAAYGSLGDTTDYSSRRDVTRDIFGLNEDGNNDLEIQGLKDIYKENGVINDKMSNDEMLDAILNAHWGADNLIDAYQWMNDAAYQQAHPFAGSSAGNAYAQYWLDNGYIPVPEGQETLFSGLSDEAWRNLDNADLAALFNAGNVINQANAGMRFGDQDLAALSSIFQGAGDKATFSFAPEGENGREWNPGTRDYSGQYIGQALSNAMNGDYSGLDPYNDFGMNLGDAYMADAVMAAIEANDKQGRKITRKDS